ncbi:MAG: aminodeoxychorismate synthase component I [Pseudomonadota bacterium]
MSVSSVIVEPVSGPLSFLDLHRSQPKRYPYLLSSAAGVAGEVQYDILFAVDGDADYFTEHALDSLDARFKTQATKVERCSLPFYGGWFVYLGYELAEHVEPSLNLPMFSQLPPVILHRAPAALIRVKDSQEIFAVAEPEYRGHIDQLLTDITALESGPSEPGPILSGLIQEQDEAPFLNSVNRARDYIYAGDIFQANLSRRWSAKLKSRASAADVYERLLKNNPAPFAALACFDGEQAIVSSSPERLLEIRDGYVQTRPIAGTRPRGATMFDDSQLSQELFASEKERAEHVMLIDLERNDLGRICVPGSVSVDEFMALESYAHVHHIVSNVRGQLRPGTTPAQAIAAVFPGGTITGCPKVRCMEIIAELEGEARGPYTGSLGYLNRDGSLDLNILIRTLHLSGRELSLRAGGGIVADSEPVHELAETRAKARGLLLALDSFYE